MLRTKRRVVFRCTHPLSEMPLYGAQRFWAPDTSISASRHPTASPNQCVSSSPLYNSSRHTTAPHSNPVRTSPSSLTPAPCPPPRPEGEGRVSPLQVHIAVLLFVLKRRLLLEGDLVPQRERDPLHTHPRSDAGQLQKSIPQIKWQYTPKVEITGRGGPQRYSPSWTIFYNGSA